MTVSWLPFFMPYSHIISAPLRGQGPSLSLPLGPQRWHSVEIQIQVDLAPVCSQAPSCPCEP